jgi:hypothetical protein
MRGFEELTELSGHRDRRRDTEWPARDDRGEVLSRDELHRDEVVRRQVAIVVHLRDERAHLRQAAPQFRAAPLRLEDLAPWRSSCICTSFSATRRP